MGEFVGFFQPMFFLVVFQLGLVAAQFIWKKVSRKKKDAKQVIIHPMSPMLCQAWRGSTASRHAADSTKACQLFSMHARVLGKART